MSYVQYSVAVPTVVGLYTTRIKLSKDQNNPAGAVVPPLTDIPLTIFVDATLLEFESAPTQLVKSPAELFCKRPLFPYTNKYG